MLPSSSSLAGRLVAPVVVLVLAAVAANVGFTAWWEIRQESLAARQRREQVADTLAQSRVAVSVPILAALHRLTGDHYVVWDIASETPGLATLPVDSAQAPLLAQGLATGSVALDEISYRVGSVRAAGVRPETVLVLSPRESLARATWNRVWPILAVAAGTLAVLVPLGLRMTSRIARQLGDIDRQVARIADGDFGSVLPEQPPRHEPDEINRLVAGVNRMSQTLAGQRESLVAGERQRLLGQMAAGFAHEVRNAVTGARLAVDLHRRRCHAAVASGPEDASLDVVIRQLDVLEEEVRGLLMLGRPEEVAATSFSATSLLQEVCDLVGPRCGHAGTRISHQAERDLIVTGRREPLRSALVNLALNGIDAAGVAGSVYLWAAEDAHGIQIGVDDTGPGPVAAIRDAMHEPFVTSKPEGIGLGLSVARTVAESHGGRLEWSRHGDSTRFVITIPAGSAAASSHTRQATA
ncbi:MAG: HAMP domain-containing sensor histidine kinase [Planctomycetota bacterium]|jgi:signal transduction histidine kinase|nr:HAMP domain-containing sensor histidine kinase [Planctomycetota bacterium]